MKLAFFDDYKLGVVIGDKIVDVSAVTKGIKALGPQDVIRGVIEKWTPTRASSPLPPRRAKASRSARSTPAAAAEAGEHHLHGGELYGGWHAAGAGAD